MDLVTMTALDKDFLVIELFCPGGSPVTQHSGRWFAERPDSSYAWQTLKGGPRTCQSWHLCALAQPGFICTHARSLFPKALQRDGSPIADNAVITASAPHFCSPARLTHTGHKEEKETWEDFSHLRVTDPWASLPVLHTEQVWTHTSAELRAIHQGTDKKLSFTLWKI